MLEIMSRCRACLQCEDRHRLSRPPSTRYIPNVCMFFAALTPRLTNDAGRPGWLPSNSPLPHRTSASPSFVHPVIKRCENKLLTNRLSSRARCPRCCATLLPSCIMMRLALIGTRLIGVPCRQSVPHSRCHGLVVPDADVVELGTVANDAQLVCLQAQTQLEKVRRVVCRLPFRWPLDVPARQAPSDLGLRDQGNHLPIAAGPGC